MIVYWDAETLEDMDMFYDTPGWRLNEAGVAKAKSWCIPFLTQEHKDNVKQRSETKQKLSQVFDKKDKIINTFFRTKGTKPNSPRKTNDTPITLTGQTIQHGKDPKDNGRGYWYVIQEDYIWYVQNRSHDGDNWLFNNIYSNGSLGVGYRIPYNEKLAQTIIELHQPTKPEQEAEKEYSAEEAKEILEKHRKKLAQQRSKSSMREIADDWVETSPDR